MRWIAPTTVGLSCENISCLDPSEPALVNMEDDASASRISFVEMAWFRVVYEWVVVFEGLYQFFAIVCDPHQTCFPFLW